MKQIDLSERRKIQLQMLREFDAFCRSNKLRYSLAYGTLLGAVRHKGFIPWDDDVDIMMPSPDMEKVKFMLKSDLVKYCDIDTEPYYEFSFSRLSHRHSYSKKGIILKSYGVCIDLYPAVGLPKTDAEIDKYLMKCQKISNKRLFLMKWRSRIIRRFPLKTIPLYSYYQRKNHDAVFQYSYENSLKRYVDGGFVWKNVFDIDLFDCMVDLPFENDVFMATSHYDYFLTQLYGDYMTPPPEDKRIPYHGGTYFWKK